MKVGAQLLKENQKYLKFLETLLILFLVRWEHPPLHTLFQLIKTLSLCTIDPGIMTLVLEKTILLLEYIMAIKSPT